LRARAHGATVILCRLTQVMPASAGRIAAASSMDAVHGVSAWLHSLTSCPISISCAARVNRPMGTRKQSSSSRPIF